MAERESKLSSSGVLLGELDRSSWRDIQRNLATKVIRRDAFDNPPKLIAGVDVAYLKDKAFSVAITLDYKTLEAVEDKTARCIAKVPYIPSFLAFREVEPMVRAIAKLKRKPHVFVVNAHGVAHPERCGCASHLGIILNIPTIGVAGEALFGSISDSETENIRYLRDGEEIIGAEVVTAAGCKPVYISIGHKVSLESAIEIVLRTTRGNRMPEPLRLAHKMSNEVRNKWKQENRV